MIFAMGLFEDSLLCREWTWSSPLSHTPLVRLEMGGSGPWSVGAQGLTWADCAWMEKVRLRMKMAVRIAVGTAGKDLCVLICSAFPDRTVGGAMDDYAGMLANCYLSDIT